MKNENLESMFLQKRDSAFIHIFSEIISSARFLNQD
ncbi:MAG: hypothetical protein ACI9DJ_000088 [Algoriphagus sp.]|jgi:hypothetical protein